MTLAKMVRWLFWSPIVRGPIVVGVFLAGYLQSIRLPIISEHANPQLVVSVLSEVAKDRIENVSNPEFAYALAAEIVRVAAGCAATFLVSYVGCALALLFIARLRLNGHKSVQDFEANFEKISRRLSNDLLLKDAWLAYARTFVRDKTKDKATQYFATVRPQGFFNASVARDQMFALRLMPSIPGYFVGLGLLLTFVGLVIALSKAAHGAAASAEEMTQSLNGLLNAATFKFATSIAGLFSSLVLSLLFRTYSILIERAFERFCRGLEPRLRMVTAQTLALRAAHAQRDQVALLQEMTTTQYMQRLGQAVAEQVGPAVGSAVGTVVEPFAASLDVDRKQGLEDLVNQFIGALKGSAGQEMTQLVEVLKETTSALKGMREDVAETGDKFAAKMAEASEAFVAIVRKAGGELGETTGNSRMAIEDTLTKLTQAAEGMRRHLEDYAAKAGASTGSNLDAMLNEMQEGLKRQTQAFEASLNLVLEKLTGSAANAAGAATAVIEGTTQAAKDAADAVSKSIGDIATSLRTDMEHMSASMSSAEQAFAGIARGAKETADQSNVAATAFGRVAERVEASSAPLLEASRRIATSTETIAASVRTTSESLGSSHAAAQALAKALQDNLVELQLYWEQHEGRFEGVDKSLKEAIETLANETETYKRGLRDFVAEIDKQLGESVKGLAAVAGNLTEGADEIAENLGKLVDHLDKVE